MLKLPLLLLACMLTLSITKCQPTNNVNGGNANAPTAQQLAKSREVDAMLSEISSFAGSVQQKAGQNNDTAAGIAEAQSLVDSQKEQMKAKVQAVKNVREEELTKEMAERRRQILNFAITGPGSLRQTAPDKVNAPDVKPKFDKLLHDYEEIFKP